MAKSSYSSQTKHMLGFFLCFIAILVLAGLYVDANKKITLLKQLLRPQDKSKLKVCCLDLAL